MDDVVHNDVHTDWQLFSAPKANVQILVVVLITEPKCKAADNRHVNQITHKHIQMHNFMHTQCGRYWKNDNLIIK